MKCLRLYVARQVPTLSNTDQRSIPFIQLQFDEKMNTEHRSLLIISGEQSHCLAHCQFLLKNDPSLSPDPEKKNNQSIISNNQTKKQLGQEKNIAIFDATTQFDANALGVISGTIRGGGLLILLLPKHHSNYPNAHFYQRLLSLLRAHHIPIYPAGEHTDTHISFSTSTKKPPILAPSHAQQQVIDAIIKVAKGRRKRPLVLTADRGRGKSTTLGLVANQLLTQEGLSHIIVCAPAKAMVQPLLQQVTQFSGLHYYPPDILDQQQPDTDLLLIDEAGAIPVPLLSRLLQRYSRIVFSTTLQGYEGNGKGFAVRFQSYLEQYTPNWKAMRLEQPVRWGANDPLEALINDILLLDAEPAVMNELPHIHIDQLCYQQLSPADLLANETQLRQLFGLLVIAHYQTRPSDLVQLLDSPQLSVHVLTLQEDIVATAIVSHEGGLSPELSQAIFQGKRRPQGHLVPQILTFQAGIPAAATQYTDRIMRIAVHPKCQRMQLGSQLLTQIRQQSTADYLSSSFGMCMNLLQFWSASTYHMAYLGLKREASSGYHSAVMLHPLTPAGEELLHTSQARFIRNYQTQLADALKYYDPEMGVALLAACQPSKDCLSLSERQDLERFAKGYCGYDLAMAALHRWLPVALADYQHHITRKDATLLLMRVLQHHDWAHCCKALTLTGKHAALKRMQQAVAALLKSDT